MIVCNKRRKIGLKIEDVYFADDYERYFTNSDIVAFKQSQKYLENSRIFYTLYIDLTKDSQTMFADLRRSYRQQIKKVMNVPSLKVVYLDNISSEELLNFVEQYKTFVKYKGIIDYNYKLLEEMSKRKMLVISYITDDSGITWCGHASLLDKEKVYCLLSYSFFRYYRKCNCEQACSLAGANKYLHWCDMLYFKEQGYKVYDFGGLALDNTDSERANIDYFKKGFGGFIVTAYNFYQARTLLGKLALKVTKKDNRDL